MANDYFKNIKDQSSLSLGRRLMNGLNYILIRISYIDKISKRDFITDLKII